MIDSKMYIRRAANNTVGEKVIRNVFNKNAQVLLKTYLLHQCITLNNYYTVIIGKNNHDFGLSNVLMLS